jgi:hypothetical protein
MKRIRIELDGSIEAEAVLYEDKAPDTVAALWKELPWSERTIQVRWSGDAWRTEGQHPLVPLEHPVENVGDRLTAGDIIFHYKGGNKVVGFCYGKAKWLGPYMVERQVAVIGKIDKNLEAFCERSKRIIFEGPLSVKVSRIEAK